MTPSNEFREAQFTTGSYGEYWWLTSSEHCIGDLLRECPEVVAGRYLAVTSTDSGHGWLTEEQKSSGWSVRSGISYSPRVTDVTQLLYQLHGAESEGFDEWYVFDAPSPELGEIIQGNPFEESNAPRPGRIVALVNFFGFAIHDADILTDMFWRQIEWIQPDSYIACGRDYLTFACKNRELFEAVKERLQSNLK